MADNEANSQNGAELEAGRDVEIKGSVAGRDVIQTTVNASTQNVIHVEASTRPGCYAQFGTYARFSMVFSVFLAVAAAAILGGVEYAPFLPTPWLGSTWTPRPFPTPVPTAIHPSGGVVGFSPIDFLCLVGAVLMLSVVLGLFVRNRARWRRKL